MGRYSGKSCRITIMLAMTLSFLLVEIIVGHLTHSLALIADAFHMLSDGLALIVGLLSVKLARRGSSKTNTYGWARAEVVGALINAVFLVALCFTIFVEAVERLAMRESIKDAKNLLYVGGVGLLINLLGLALFHNHAHGHTHGGMSHSHGDHGHSHNGHSHTHNSHGQDAKSDSSAKKISASLDESVVSLVGEIGKPECRSDKKQATSHQLNMRGVFIHVLGDALGSVVVMISAGLTLIARNYIYSCHTDIKVKGEPVYTGISNGTGSLTYNTTAEKHCMDEQIDAEWVKCIDPVLSLVLVAIILCTSIPLLKQTAYVLMQTVPEHLMIDEMHADIIRMRGVLDIHEFHVWSLAGNKVIASLHVRTKSVEDYVKIARKIKQYLHREGIHSVTLQPEFESLQHQSEGRQCALECGPDMDCHGDTCCCSRQIKGIEANGKHTKDVDMRLEDAADTV